MAQKIPWDETYAIGIKSIDDQHKNLFELVNRLYELEEQDDVKEEMRKILYEFREYMMVHFKDEEEYMASISFPELAEHKVLHDEIVEQLTKIMQTPASLNIIQVRMKIVAKRALIEHILHEDLKIKLYQIKNEVKQDDNIIDLESI